MNASPPNQRESINYSQLGYLRVAATTPSLVIGDAAANAELILQQANDLAAQGVALAAFPELCLTGYSAEDLFFSETLLAGTEKALQQLCACTVSYTHLTLPTNREV